MSRPTLKIIRHDDRAPPGNITFRVWNPITGCYEAMPTLGVGLSRLDELVERVRMMWKQHDPARASLKDAPEPTNDDDPEWAELRVSRGKRVYGTRNFDQWEWRQARGRAAAVQTICNEVGYVPT